MWGKMSNKIKNALNININGIRIPLVDRAKLQVVVIVDKVKFTENTSDMFKKLIGV